jgi:hypothetical protein
VPDVVAVNTAPLTLQPESEPFATAYVTAPVPDPPDVVSVNPAWAPDVDVTMSVDWLPAPTAKFCVNWVVPYAVLPMSLKLSMQFPMPTNETTFDEMVHTDGVSVLITTVSCDVAVAEAVYVEPPTVAEVGAVDVMMMVLESWPFRLQSSNVIPWPHSTPELA